jgi:hypothetical protein
MNCEDFRNSFDELSDSRRWMEKSNLSPDMTAHLEICADCTEYFETMNTVQRTLMNMQREKILPDLYWQLIKLGEKRSTTNWVISMKPVVLRVLKILVPVLPLWIIALFVPEPVRAIIEMLTLVSGLALMFEKIGTAIITDRV